MIDEIGFERLEFRVGANPVHDRALYKRWNTRPSTQQGGVQLPFTFQSESKFNSNSLESGLHFFTRYLILLTVAMSLLWGEKKTISDRTD